MWIEWLINRTLKEKPSVVEGGSDKGQLPLNQRASERVSSNCSVFSKNDVYLEVCTQFEHLRGLLGAFVVLVPGALVYFVSHLAWSFVALWIRGSSEDGGEVGFEGYFCGVLAILMALGVWWLFWKFAWPFVNKDYFTTRRVLIRFNRITRKVYLHRPAFAGGIATFDWDAISAALDDQGGPDNPGDGRLAAGWTAADNKTIIGFEFIGHAAGNDERGRAWWEYIRRYMEEGADSVPRPFPRLWKGAWPHMSLLEMFYLFPERLIHGGPFWWCVLLILAPINLLRAGLHWIAMLLCVEPKFPPEIENAGKEMLALKRKAA